MNTLLAYLQIWKLKLSHTKTATAVFHLNNRNAKRKLKLYNNTRILLFCPIPCSGKTRQIAQIPSPSSGIAQKTQPVGPGWRTGAKTLRIAALSLVYSTAEHCAPVWCCSAHTRLIESILNNAFLIVTGCLRPTLADHLSIL